MARNLVPLYIDKVSGDIIATGNSSNSNPNANTGFEFIQSSPILTWIIAHNANNEKLLCQIYDSNNNLIWPDEIKIVDQDLITVSFVSPLAGTAKIVFF